MPSPACPPARCPTFPSACLPAFVPRDLLKSTLLLHCWYCLTAHSQPVVHICSVRQKAALDGAALHCLALRRATSAIRSVMAGHSSAPFLCTHMLPLPLQPLPSVMADAPGRAAFLALPLLVLLACLGAQVEVQAGPAALAEEDAGATVGKAQSTAQVEVRVVGCLFSTTSTATFAAHHSRPNIAQSLKQL